jgi:tRNA pseudouridine32 synthase/23S rRNA pseudouridine746 synthase
VTSENQSSTAVDLLADKTEMPKARIKDAMAKGAVWRIVNGKSKRIRRAKTVLNEGELLELYYDAGVLSQIPPEPELIHSEPSYSVWNKPVGLLSSGSKYGDHCAIDRWIERTTNKETFLVHRLDRFATGLMVVAHNKAAAANLSDQFSKRKVEKHYEVIVEGKVTSGGTIATELDGKPAITHFSVLNQIDDRSHLSVNIETGRKHQIRKHLAELGFPVVGDRQYGDETTTEALQLTACYLAFNCPATKWRKEFNLDQTYRPSLTSTSAVKDSATTQTGSESPPQPPNQ